MKFRASEAARTRVGLGRVPGSHLDPKRLRSRARRWLTADSLIPRWRAIRRCDQPVTYRSLQTRNWRSVITIRVFTKKRLPLLIGQKLKVFECKPLRDLDLRPRHTFFCFQRSLDFGGSLAVSGTVRRGLMPSLSRTSGIGSSSENNGAGMPSIGHAWP